MSTPKTYSLYFSECRQQATDNPRKIAVTLSDVTFHQVTTEVIAVEFVDGDACRMALEFLGADWQHKTENSIACQFNMGLGYKIQSLYFENVTAKP